MSNPEALLMPQELFSIEAEQTTIGALLIDNAGWQLVGQRLLPEMFFRHDHREVMTVIAGLCAKGIPADPFTVASNLKEPDLVYLCELQRNTPSARTIETYADIVIDRYTRRRVAAIGNDAWLISKSAKTGGEAIGEVRAKIDAISTASVGGAESVDDSMAKWVASMHERKSRGGSLQGRETGFTSINNRWYGLCEPDLIIIAGRPSMGKTTFGMNVADGAAANGASVLFFSLEMSINQLMDKRISAISGVALDKIRRCDLESHEWDLVMDATQTIKRRNLVINPTAGISIDSAYLSAAEHKSRHGLDVVVVDYLGLMTAPGSESRVREIAAISAGLKKMAKNLHIPVIALSQLNRKCEDRANKRPTLADLRDSGDIEQDADIVAFVHRQEKYEPESQEWKGVAEIITEKHRNGECGTDFLSSDLARSRFLEMDGPFYRPKFEGKQKTRRDSI